MGPTRCNNMRERAAREDMAVAMETGSCSRSRSRQTDSLPSPTVTSRPRSEVGLVDIHSPPPSIPIC